MERGLWQRPARLGYQESLRGLGGSGAPFLAGFSLATIALLLTTSTGPTLSGPAIAAFAFAAALFIYSMQTAFLALEHYATPADWLNWFPEATVNKRSLNDIRARQAGATRQVKKIWWLHAITWEVGILFFLLGLFLLLWPRFPKTGDPSVWRLVALAPVGVALLVEMFWGLARLWPRAQTIEKAEVSEVTPTQEAAALDPARRAAAQLGYPELGADPNADGM